MSRDAYVFGELTWPMPDPGMVAVWRAMALDASRWDDWEGFVDDLREGTVGAMVDEVSSAPEFQLDVDEVGARLRARVTDDRADTWRRLAIAWRAAADLGASGEFGWRPCEDGSPGFRAVIRDYNSQWEKVESIDVPNDLAAGGEAVSAVPHSIDDSVGEAIMDMDSIADALLAMDSLEMTGETPAETAADATVSAEIEVVARMPGEDAEPVPLAELDDSDLDADADSEDEPAPAAKKPAAKAKAKAPAAKKPAAKAKAKPAAKKPAAKKPAAKAKAKAPAAKKPAAKAKAKAPAAKKPAKKKR